MLDTIKQTYLMNISYINTIYHLYIKYITNIYMIYYRYSMNTTNNQNKTNDDWLNDYYSQSFCGAAAAKKIDNAAKGIKPKGANYRTDIYYRNEHGELMCRAHHVRANFCVYCQNEIYGIKNQ